MARPETEPALPASHAAKASAFGSVLLPALLVAVSVLPNPRAAIPGLTYYFRDFSLTYYPLRDFFSREAAAGRFPFWNPFIHEGSAFLPVFYPLELLHAWWSGPAAVSWLLTVHFPIAALAMYALARELGCEARGAFVAGAVYATGGLALSCLNLHWFLQALALAPLLAWACLRAALRGGRSILLAAVVLAVSISTLAVEFVAQGLLVGSALGLAVVPRRRAGARLALVVALGAGLAAVPVALVLGILRESLRGTGFGPDIALRNAAHPLVLLQTVIPNLFGSVAQPLRYWWSGRLFDQGSPYFMSLYLGPLALGCAAVGATALDPRRRSVLLALGLLGLWYALGQPAGLAPALAPVLRWFRYPCKALLLPHLVTALLAGLGASRLRDGDGWERLGRVCGLMAAPVLVVAFGMTLRGPTLAEWLDVSPTAEAAMRRTLLLEAGEAIAFLLLGLALAGAVRSGKTSPARAASLLGILVVLDLGRAGLGLNPQVSPAFFEPLPEMAAQRLAALDGGRVFSYGVERSPVFRAFLQQRGAGVDLWSFFVDRQMLDPYTNIVDRVESAEAPDRLSFIATPAALRAEDYDPGAVAGILPRLRNAAVTRLLSLDPLEHPDLRLRATVPAGPPGLAIHVYEDLHPWPRAYIACRAVGVASRADALARPAAPGFDPMRDVVLEVSGAATCVEGRVERRQAGGGEESYEVESDGDGYLVMRDSFARGWRASVDGRPAPVLRANGRHRAVPVGAGKHAVVLGYAPPGLRAGLALMALSMAAGAAVLAHPVLGEAPVEARR